MGDSTKSTKCASFLHCRVARMHAPPEIFENLSLKNDHFQYFEIHFLFV